MDNVSLAAYKFATRASTATLAFRFEGITASGATVWVSMGTIGGVIFGNLIVRSSILITTFMFSDNNKNSPHFLLNQAV